MNEILESYMHAQLLSRVRLFATLWTVACQVPLSMEFPGKNTRVGCHFLLQEIFLTQGLKLHLFKSPTLAGGFFTTSTTWKPEQEWAGRKPSLLLPTSLLGDNSPWISSISTRLASRSAAYLHHGLFFQGLRSVVSPSRAKDMWAYHLV